MKLFFQVCVFSTCYIFSILMNAQESIGIPLKADQMPLGVRNATQAIADVTLGNDQSIKLGFFITEKHFIAPIDKSFLFSRNNPFHLKQWENALQGDKRNTVHKGLPSSSMFKPVGEARFTDSLLTLWWSGTEDLPFPDLPLGIFEVKRKTSLPHSFLKLANFQRNFKFGDSLYLLVNIKSDVHRIAVIEITGIQSKDIGKGDWISLEKINSPYLEWAKGAFKGGIVVNRQGDIVALLDSHKGFLRLRKVDSSLESLKDRIEARQQSRLAKKLSATQHLQIANKNTGVNSSSSCGASFKK